VTVGARRLAFAVERNVAANAFEPVPRVAAVAGFDLAIERVLRDRSGCIEDLLDRRRADRIRAGPGRGRERGVAADPIAMMRRRSARRMRLGFACPGEVVASLDPRHGVLGAARRHLWIVEHVAERRWTVVAGDQRTEQAEREEGG
jgi:hypothetical protein